jgi:hypothetical protein
MATRKKKDPRASAPRKRVAKAFLLPMPRAQADAMSLQSRIALETVRRQKAGRHEATCMAQVVMLTSFLTEAGHGRIDLPSIRGVETEVLALLQRGVATGDWSIPEALVESLTAIVNENDRQLREVRLAAVVDATERLDRVLASIPKKLLGAGSADKTNE